MITPFERFTLCVGFLTACAVPFVLLYIKLRDICWDAKCKAERETWELQQQIRDDELCSQKPELSK